MEPSAENPFKGLQPYSQQDQQKLFGRDKDLILIKDRIYSAKTTLLFAGSGVGKTSFLNAKVIPEFKQQYDVFYHNEWAGKDKPLDAVKKRLVKQLGLEESLSEQHLQVVLTRFKRTSGSRVVSGMGETGDDSPCRCLMILDQFEEVFQYHSYEDYFEQFLEELCAVINEPQVQLRVLFSMREEFLGELSVFDNQIPDLFNNYYRLKYPDRSDAKEIITRTCDLVDTNVDEEKLNQLVRDLSKVEKTAASYTEHAPDDDHLKTRIIERSFIVPPHLQISCRKLWARQFTTSRNGDSAPQKSTFRLLPQRFGIKLPALWRRKGSETVKRISPQAVDETDPHIFLSDYQDDEAQKMLQDFCIEKLNKLTLFQRYTAARAFNYLVTKQGAKMAYESKRLSQHMRVNEKRLEHTLKQLSKPDARILRISRGPDGSNWFELYHDMYGTIVDRWKQGFQRRLMRGALAAFAGAILFASLIVIMLLAVPHWITNPRVYTSIIEASDGSDYPLAREAYESLRNTFGYESRADALWTKFWERRAADAVRSGWREDALIFSLQALAVERDPEAAKRRRTSAGLLVGDDYNSLLATYRQEGSYPKAIFSADGKLVLTQAFVTDKDLSVRSWNTATGEPVSGSVNLEGANLRDESPDSAYRRYYLTSFPVVVKALVTTPNSLRLIAGIRTNQDTSDKEVLVWNADSGKLYPDAERNWCPPASEAIVAFSVDGRYLAAGGDDVIYVWRLDTNTRQVVLSKAGKIRSLAFSPDGTTLLAGDEDGRARLWDMSTGRLRKVSGRLGQLVNRVTFSPDGSAFLTQHKDGSIEVWETATGNPSGRTIKTGYVASNNTDDLELARREQIMIWEESHEMYRPLISQRSNVTDLTFTAYLTRDNQTVITLPDSSRQFYMGRAVSYRRLIERMSEYRTGRFPPRILGTGPTLSLWGAGFDNNQVMQAWDSRTGNLQNQFTFNVKDFNSTLLSPDGEALLTTANHAAQLWKLPLQTTEQKNTSSSLIQNLSFSGDGKILISESKTRKLELWNAQTGTSLGSPNGYVRPDQGQVGVYGNVIALSEGKIVRVMELDSGKVIASLSHPGYATKIVYSSDGRTLVTVDASSSLNVWDTSSYEKRFPPVKPKEMIRNIYLSAFGRYLVVRSYDTPLLILDTASGSPVDLQEIDQSKLEKTVVAISRDERVIAIGTDSNKRIWDLSSGKLLGVLSGDSEELSFSNDGKLLLIKDERDAVSLWNVEHAVFLEGARGDLISSKTIRHSLNPDLISIESVNIVPSITSISFSPDSKSLLIMTGNWVHLYQVEGNTLKYVSSRLIGGKWVKSFFLDETGKKIRFFFRSFEGTLRFNDVQFDVFDSKNALDGEPKDLLDEWQNKLALTINNKGSLIPKWQE
jgi:WD40 repeat protein